jgi:hypothetical protein
MRWRIVQVRRNTLGNQRHDIMVSSHSLAIISTDSHTRHITSITNSSGGVDHDSEYLYFTVEDSLTRSTVLLVLALHLPTWRTSVWYQWQYKHRLVVGPMNLDLKT